MIVLVQFPWSGYCIAQRKILEYSGKPFKIKNIPSTDRSYVWKITRNRYYQVPVIKDGKSVIFETDEESQIIAKYIDAKYDLGLFPKKFAGVQNLIWRHIENDVEDVCSKLNDICYEEFVPKKERLLYLRHKERKFGRGCIDQWRLQQEALLAELEKRLWFYEQMLSERKFLLDEKPLFVDFDLFGILSALLFSGHYKLPAAHNRLAAWYNRMEKVELPKANNAS
ncbi:MAG: glutathione S-transferase family protein [Verrucomicrobiia bacterium]